MVEKRRLVLDHAIIGKSFRSNAGAVMQALKALDDAGIASIERDLKDHGHASIKLSNQICQVTSDMVRVEVKTEKQSGTLFFSMGLTVRSEKVHAACD